MGLRDKYLKPRITFRDADLTAVLREVNARAGFNVSILATDQGLTVVSVPDTAEIDTASAMVALLQEAIRRAQERLDFPGVDEVSALFNNGLRLVCRYFDLSDVNLILAVILPAGREYRAPMDEAIRRLADMLTAAPQPELAATAA